MKKNIKIKINSRQSYDDDSDENINHDTKGILFNKNNNLYLVYDDNVYHGARTTIKIDSEKDRIFVSRDNPDLTQIYKQDSQTIGKYDTPYGKFKLEIHTTVLDIEIEKSKGNVYIKYKLYMNKQYISQNYLQIFWNII
ncbi:MAG: DUF1934 domain-containing protein [Halanaerobiaceae bacterium]